MRRYQRELAVLRKERQQIGDYSQCPGLACSLRIVEETKGDLLVKRMQFRNINRSLKFDRPHSRPILHIPKNTFPVLRRTEKVSAISGPTAPAMLAISRYHLKIAVNRRTSRTESAWYAPATCAPLHWYRRRISLPYRPPDIRGQFRVRILGTGRQGTNSSGGQVITLAVKA